MRKHLHFPDLNLEKKTRKVRKIQNAFVILSGNHLGLGLGLNFLFTLKGRKKAIFILFQCTNDGVLYTRWRPHH